MGGTDIVHQRNYWQYLPSIARPRWLDVLKFFILLFFSLFDFYKWGFRIFDIAALPLVAIASLTLIGQKWIKISLLISVAVAGVYAAVGLLSTEYYLTVLAIFVNFFLFFVLSLKEFKPSQKQIEVVLLIHIFFFFFQLVSFYQMEKIINYHAFTDIDPRLESSIFRPAGLFYEPAMYCYTTLILTTMLDSKKSKYGILEALAMVSMVLSVSFLGFAFAALIITKQILAKKFMAPILCVLTISFVSSEQQIAILTFIENRVSDLGADASAQGRYGELFNIVSSKHWIYSLFGRGFGASFEQFGASGASAAISAVGVLGVMAFTGWMLFRSRELMAGFIALVGIMISAPIFSYMIFPYWMANIVRRRGVCALHNADVQRRSIVGAPLNGR